MTARSQCLDLDVSQLTGTSFMLEENSTLVLPETSPRVPTDDRRLVRVCLPRESLPVGTDASFRRFHLRGRYQNRQKVFAVASTCGDGSSALSGFRLFLVRPLA
jgi:hypothetical protein